MSPLFHVKHITDHAGNTLAETSCALCRRCWIYVLMKDWRQNNMLGDCIYGGPFSNFRQGYEPGEIERKMKEVYRGNRHSVA